LPSSRTLPMGAIIWYADLLQALKLVQGTYTPQQSRPCRAYTIACNGAGGRVGFEIDASRAGPLMRVVELKRVQCLLLTSCWIDVGFLANGCAGGVCWGFSWVMGFGGRGLIGWSGCNGRFDKRDLRFFDCEACWNRVSLCFTCTGPTMTPYRKRSCEITPGRAGGCSEFVLILARRAAAMWLLEEAIRR